MDSNQSAKFEAPNEWAVALRARASQKSVVLDLQKILEAYRGSSSFYAARLAGISCWPEIPPLQKAELAAVPLSTDERIYAARTSGTSGVQVTVRNSISERRFRQALAYRPFLFYPLDKTVRQLVFVDGADVDVVDKQQWPFEFGERSYLTWRVGVAAPPEKILQLLQSVKPHVVRGLTSGIVSFIEAIGGGLAGLGVQVVSTSGETLTSEWRDLMHDAFAAPVLDRYGSTEVGSMAWQCPFCNDYHANSDEIVLEESPQGLLATPLFIESQPLLRYCVGDEVEMLSSAHECRIRLPKLRLRAARRDDWIVDGAGRRESPLSFQFEQLSGLRAWRIHQLASGVLRLYYDAETDIDTEAEAELREQLVAQLRRIVSDRDVELVAGIWQLERGGKFKRVVSDLV
ncbi:MAG: hypothetical protein ACR2P6_10040 [Gammaproteobacteria bacterium]